MGDGTDRDGECEAVCFWETCIRNKSDPSRALFSISLWGWLDWLDVASAVSGTQMPWKNMKQLGWLAQHRKGSFYELYYVDSGCIGIIFVGICLFVIVCGGKQKLHKQASFRNTSWPSSIDMSALFFLQGLGFDQMTHAFWKHITRATLSIAVVITVPQNIHPHAFLYPFKSRVSLWLQK